MAPYGALPVPRLTPELISLVKSGKVYSLAVIYHEGMPQPGVLEPYSLTPRIRHGDLTGIGPVSGAGETIKMAAHTGTHIDALCHIAEYQDEDGNPVSEGGEARIYAGPGKTVPAAEHVNFQGQTLLDIAEMPPIVTRGILLDVPGYLGLDILPEGYTIGRKDVEGTMARQGTRMKPGTAVLVRTGYYQLMREGNPAFMDAVAGFGLEADKMLVKQGMILVGADNPTVEPWPPYDHDVHRYNLVHHGITHMEVMYLDELAADQVYEFLLIVTPLRLQGSTGSWVHPIAIA
jgi:kynurenine formamidase